MTRAEAIAEADRIASGNFAQFTFTPELITTLAADARAVVRIQADFADDFGDRNGDIYEQVKDFVAQFYAEREQVQVKVRAWRTVLTVLMYLELRDRNLGAYALERLVTDHLLPVVRSGGASFSHRGFREAVEELVAQLSREIDNAAEDTV
jgi:hypothetical protein